MNETDRTAIVLRYLDEVREQFESGHAIEHAYRPALKALMSKFEDTVAVNDPKHSEHGAPDFIFLKKSNLKIIKGHAEAKDIGKDLDKEEKSDQMSRYAGYANLILTDYLEFRFFRNGDKYETISLGCVKNNVLNLTPENGERLICELEAFLDQTPESIKSGKRLAQIMGGKARRIRDNVSEYLTSDDIDSTELSRIYEMMTKLLVHDLEPKKFADMYAQTLVYGLFVARYGDDTPDSFTRSEARDLVPKNNPFLRHFFDHIVGPNFDTRLGYIVDELCEIFSVSNVQEIVHKHLRIQDITNDDKDPIIHFYEDFLQEYDPKIRKDMGAYYTPTPVVKFIIRHVDKILKEDFGITKGLASIETFTKKVNIGQKVSIVKTGNTRVTSTSVIDKKFHRVQILDPAVGTATFLNETIKFIYEQFKGQEGRWPSYVAENLIHRLHGFELMMAPYTIAHLKLGMTLKETGVENLKDRLGVYLTNTLEEGTPTQQDLFSFGLAQAVSEESQHAAEVKNERPIMIVMGNPPYSGVSSNETEYANKLIAKYKVEPGGMQKLQERKHWLNDDYVKFIAFAEDMINKNGDGIVAMITNNGYLDNSTFRGMRWQLLKSFDKIYILNLHGNANKKEVSPNGDKDENVFDIMQGVGIIIAIKNGDDSSGLADIYHAEIYGKRQYKFDMLNMGVEFKKIESLAPSYYFVPKNNIGKDEYDQGVGVDELFCKYVTGIVTMGDDFIINENPNVIAERVEKLQNGDYTKDTLNNEFRLGKNYADFILANASKLQVDPLKIIKLSYRPFDERYTYFDNKVLWRWREEVMRNFIGHENIGLVTTRLQKENPGAFITATIMGHKTYNAYDSNSVFPLYIYHSDGSITPNIKRDLALNLLEGMSFKLGNEVIFLKYQEDKIERDYVLAKSQREKQNVYPADLLDYIYATLNSPSYKENYKEFLKADFPRIPKPKDGLEFWRLAQLGNELRNLHLMRSSLIDDYSTTFPVPGDNIVADVRYFARSVDISIAGKPDTKEKYNEENAVYINKTQYFGNVPKEIWEFYIGGYQPAQKWLKDRRGRELTNNDIEHYQRIIKILIETDRIMKQIG